MRARTYCYALGDRLFNPEKLENRFSQDIAYDSGDDYHHHGKGDISPEFIGHTHTYGGSYGFGKEGDVGLVVEPEEQGQQQYADQA